MPKKIVGFALLVALLGGGAAYAMSWEDADRACKGAGAGCCATADESGNPKMRDGTLVCHCGLVASSAKPTVAQRIAFGKLGAGNKFVKMSRIPTPAKASPVAKSKLKAD